MKIFALLLLAALSSGCAVVGKSERQGDFSLVTKEDVGQGFYEEFLFVSDNYRGVYVQFDVDKRYPGRWLPMVGVALSDKPLQRHFRVKLAVQEKAALLSFELYDGDNVLLDESVALGQMPSSLEMTWDGRVASVDVDGKRYDFELPFDIAFIKNTSSSIAVTKSIRLLEK